MEGIVLGGKKGVFIHLSGAANIFSTLLHHGTASTKTWSDIHDLPQIQNFDETHIHHTTEQLLFHAQETHGIKSAIVAPAGIFGVGEGIKKLSFGIPPLLEAFKKRGKMFAVNEGLNTMAASHVKDVADVLVMFVEEALEAESKKITWGGDAFYYVESGGYVFADLAAAVGKLMVEKGLIGSEEVERISPEEVLEMHFAAALMWGSNMDVKADRLKGLGWEPKQKDVFEYLEEMLPRGA
ncbi:hypothetical protein M7I_7642 [Glarea lozoyensis 74030]|nr:hypothetical protein M7I_7642 [Glarea lozoyensis 74030]